MGERGCGPVFLCFNCNHAQRRHRDGSGPCLASRSGFYADVRCGCQGFQMPALPNPRGRRSKKGGADR